jgi:Ser/Thr protein kinase RdoA (MazF antagonist)
MLEQDTARLLCLRYGLGELAAAPQPVAGGLIHRLYRLPTTTGTFAVKVLDPQIMRQPSIRAEFRRTEQIAAMFASLGVPAILALEGSGGTVQDIGTITVIVYPWCAGEMLPKSAAAPYQARQIGAILGRIHTLNLRLPGERPPGPASRRKPMPAQEWKTLVERGQEQGIEWAAALEAALPDLLRWDKAGQEAERWLPQAQIISHCDLDQKNVLWLDDNALVVIDWESAGPTRPAAELIGAALDWSGQSDGPPVQEVFAAVVAGYRREAEFPARLALPLMCSRLAGWADWLGANMHRSLSSKASPEERALAVRETQGTLATMYALATGMETWAKWCD